MFNRNKSNKKILSMRKFLNHRRNIQPYNVRCDNMTALCEGNNGEKVQHLQRMLVNLVSVYHTIPVLEIDGKFGPNTKLATMAFQNEVGLTPTGVVDTLTWDKIHKILGKTSIESVRQKCSRENEEKEYLNQSNNIIRYGSKGRYVVILQEYLNKISETKTTIPKLEVDGNFGTKTKTSLIEFQRLFNLKQDGIAGDDTWLKLYNETTGNQIDD